MRRRIEYNEAQKQSAMQQKSMAVMQPKQSAYAQQSLEAARPRSQPSATYMKTADSYGARRVPSREASDAQLASDAHMFAPRGQFAGSDYAQPQSRRPSMGVQSGGSYYMDAPMQEVQYS